MPVFFLVGAAFLPTCDTGLTALPTIPVAVGAIGGVFYADFCTKDSKEGSVTLYRCTDETPTKVVSATVGPPFAVVMATTALVLVKANGVGRSTIVVEVLIKSGETRRVVAPIEARAIDSVKLTLKCSSATGKPLPMAPLTLFQVGYIVSGGGIALTTGGLPLPVDAQGLTPGDWSTDKNPGDAKFRTGAAAGMGLLTSPKDPSLAFAVEVVDRSAVTVAWKTESGNISASSGVTRLRPTATTSGRLLCNLPGGTWSATVMTPGVCDVAPAEATGYPMASEYAVSATFPEGANPAFAVRGRAPGTCTVEVRDESSTWVTAAQLAVSSL